MSAPRRRLQKFHGPIGDLFPRLGRCEPFELSAEAVASFREQGWVKGGAVLDERQIEALREALERVRRDALSLEGELYEIDEDWRRDPERNVFHFLGAWLLEEAFHDLLWHPAVTVKAAQLLGYPRVRLWHDQVFYKPPRHPGVVTWHQDYSYWTRAAPPRHVTCWIGLDDSTLESGCVHYVSGSHRWGLLPRVSLTRDMDAVLEVLTPAQRAAFRPEPMVLKAGECTFHDSHTLHGSYGNRSDRPRRGVVLNFMHPETRCADGEKPLLAGVPLVPEGEVIAGEYFPILIA
ncbi:MAG TPA: phytanoyl-CoA dioxygenase family protein [Planctomycetota bacterium]|nr:phytanoyl-CoA dioxygenase family protein [Planctomycetota bacterium]